MFTLVDSIEQLTREIKEFTNHGDEFFALAKSMCKFEDPTVLQQGLIRRVVKTICIYTDNDVCVDFAFRFAQSG